MMMSLRKQVAFISCLLAFSSTFAGERVSLFNGKDLSGWKTASVKEKAWGVGTAVIAPEEPTELKVSTPGNELVGSGKCPNLISEREFGDCRVELEFMIPKDSNSGIKLMRIYEIQILDSYGKEAAGPGDCGAIYKERAPNVNACKKPGEWQKLLIEFKAPRFDDSGKKVADAQF